MGFNPLDPIGLFGDHGSKTKINVTNNYYGAQPAGSGLQAGGGCGCNKGGGGIEELLPLLLLAVALKGAQGGGSGGGGYF